MKKLTVTRLLVSERSPECPDWRSGLWSSNNMKKLTVTRLLVSEQSSEGFDCLSRSMEHNNMKKNAIKNFKFFL